MEGWGKRGLSFGSSNFPLIRKRLMQHSLHTTESLIFGICHLVFIRTVSPVSEERMAAS